MYKKYLYVLCLACFSPIVSAAWQSTGWVDANVLNIHMDNGNTYFSGFTLVGNCELDRLELRETGGYYNNPENAKRMFSYILAAKAQGKRIKLGYNDNDGPNCKVAQVYAEW